MKDNIIPDYYKKRKNKSQDKKQNIIVQKKRRENSSFDTKNINQKSSNAPFIPDNISEISLDNTPSLSFMSSTLKNDYDINNIKNHNYFFQRDIPEKNVYNNIFKEEKRIKPFTEKQIKALISNYLFISDLNNKIIISKSSNDIISSECYLINENWMNEYKNFYFYNELINEIKQMKVYKKSVEIIYNNLSLDFCAKIEKVENLYNFNFSNPRKAQIINYDDYYNKFKIIDIFFYEKIKNFFNGKIYLTRIKYLINQGKLIIQFNSNNNYELLIGNYDIENDKYFTELLLKYDNKEGMEHHFNIFSKTNYLSFKLYKFINGKNYLINNEREQTKIGVVYNIRNKKPFEYIKSKNQTEQSINQLDIMCNLLTENENEEILRTEIEYRNDKKYKEDYISKENRYEIEFDSYSFFTTLPIPNLSCINCNSEIELESIKFNDKNEDDIIIFNCLGECGKIDNISIKEYLKKFLLNTYLHQKCNSCEKLQLNVTNNIFNYCLECNKIFCIQCYNNHNHKYHNMKINDINNKCFIHENKYLKCYCYEDKKKLSKNA